MDDRIRPNRWAVALFVGTFVGCQSGQFGSLTQSSSHVPVMHRPESGEATVARAVSTESKKKEPVKASTFVAVAAYRQEMAENPELPFAEAEQIRATARAAFQEALKIDPKCTAAYIGLAKSYVKIEDGTKAFEMYEKALAQVPNDANLWYEKGMTHARFKDWEGAVASLNRAAKIDPDNRLYRRAIGLTLSRAGKFNEAYTELNKCMRPEESLYTLARMSTHLEQPDLAREYLALSLKAHPTFMPAHEMMAELNHPRNNNPIMQASHQQSNEAPRVQVNGIE